jgi:hypothetical protein
MLQAAVVSDPQVKLRRNPARARELITETIEPHFCH